jgi:hypothetical protein
VADVSGRYEWDAVNEEWIPDRQIGWRSVNGLSNYGRVVFQSAGERQTRIDVGIHYHPPAGLLGNIGEHLGVGKHFDDVLQHDLNNFAEMVRQAPVNALDPNSSEYLFHEGSAAAQGTTTAQQNATMGGEFSTPEGIREEGARPVSVDPELAARTSYNEDISAGRESPAQSTAGSRRDSLTDRPVLDQDIINEPLPPTPTERRTDVAMGSPDLPGHTNPVLPPDYREENPEVPPEQIPRWERPEGGQPQP